MPKARRVLARRDFLKIISALAASLPLAGCRLENDMPLFDQLLLKVAQKETLSPMELESFRQEAKRLNDIKEGVGAWIGANGQLDLNKIHAREAEFDILPLGLIHLSSTSNQSTVNSDFTIISFLTAPFLGKPAFFTWDVDEPTKISIANVGTSSRGIMMFGAVQFANNSTGRRAVAIGQYTAADAVISTVVGAMLPPVTGQSTILPVSIPIQVDPTAAYLKISTYQNSGGALDVESIALALILTK
jgi:hypothetical protein